MSLLAREVILDAESLQQWVLERHDFAISYAHALGFVLGCRQKPIRLSEHNLELRLKRWLIQWLEKPPPRPVANLNRINYPLDNFARGGVGGMTGMHCLTVGGNEAGPGLETSIRRMEEIGGHIGETQMLLELGARFDVEEQ